METAKTKTQKPKTLIRKLTTKNISNYKTSYLTTVKESIEKNRKNENSAIKQRKTSWKKGKVCTEKTNICLNRANQEWPEERNITITQVTNQTETDGVNPILNDLDL